MNIRNFINGFQPCNVHQSRINKKPLDKIPKAFCRKVNYLKLIERLPIVFGLKGLNDSSRGVSAFHPAPGETPAVMNPSFLK